MSLCQAAVTLRVWYLFSRNAFVRTVAVTALCGSVTASFTMVSTLVGSMEKLFTSGISIQTHIPGKIVWLFVPALIDHTLLFALKVYRFAQGRKSLHVEAPLRRFFKEGMLMYAFAMGSLVFSIICLSFTAPSQLSIFVLALTRWASYHVRRLLHIAVLSAADFFPLSASLQQQSPWPCVTPCSVFVRWPPRSMLSQSGSLTMPR
ncbi:hypothetical protein M404DRAFT_991898 [Pisolithus tinctorius Marx 270]|uniref:Uncharacterized protein n=1 Tax=Pisolithus tinctorius Marx 270 TaxID=870435 RepID=A0A0C3PZB5_PISTI|nr:hypothetical protein M404DRAFT_991898 [Pisolithus tinctorius Marx 270]